MLVRGDHRVNDIKLTNALGDDVPARARGRSSPSASAPPARSARSAPTCPILLDDAVAPGAVRHRRQPRGPPPARGRAGPRLPLQARRRPHASSPATPSTATRSGSSRRSRSATSSSSARATPRSFGATYLDEAGAEQPIWMGSYGIGPGAHLRRRGRAVRRRAGDLVAALDLAVRRPPRRPRQGGHRGARARRPALRGAARGRPRRHLRRPRRSGRARSSPTPSCSAARCA